MTVAMLGRVRRLARRPASVRTAWGTADQAVSSLSNFGLGLLVVRAVDVREFGVYSLLMATYLMAMGSVRAMYVEPFTIRSNAADDPGADDGSRAVLGGAVAVSLLIAAPCMVLAALTSGSTATAVLALGVTIPGLLLQDAYRMLFFALLRPRDAFLNDVMWTVLQFAAAGFVLATGRVSVATMVLAWGGGATAAAAYGLVQSGRSPDPWQAASYLHRNRDLSAPFLGEFWTYSGILELTTYAMTIVTSLATLGAFRAAALFMGPLNLLNNATVVVALPELSRIRRRSLRRVRRSVASVGAGLSIAALSLGLVLTILPDAVGVAIAGPTWRDLIPVIFPLALARAGSGAVTGALLGTRVLEAGSRMLRTRLVTAPLVAVLTLVGAHYWNASGAAGGMAVGIWASVVVWWMQYGAAERDFIRANAGDAL